MRTVRSLDIKIFTSFCQWTSLSDTDYPICCILIVVYVLMLVGRTDELQKERNALTEGSVSTTPALSGAPGIIEGLRTRVA